MPGHVQNDTARADGLPGERRPGPTRQYRNAVARRNLDTARTSADIRRIHDSCRFGTVDAPVRCVQNPGVFVELNATSDASRSDSARSRYASTSGRFRSSSCDELNFRDIEPDVEVSGLDEEGKNTTFTIFQNPVIQIRMEAMYGHASILHMCVNVADATASIAFYEQFGFRSPGSSRRPTARRRTTTWPTTAASNCNWQTRTARRASRWGPAGTISLSAWTTSTQRSTASTTTASSRARPTAGGRRVHGLRRGPRRSPRRTHRTAGRRIAPTAFRVTKRYDPSVPDGRGAFDDVSAVHLR